MRFETGIQLLSGMSLVGDAPQQWADLGCGTGFFTNTLAHLLPHGSNIEAVDKELQKLPSVMGKDVRIRFTQTDFTKARLQLKHFDGILIANALHYVKDKLIFLRHIKKHLKKYGLIVLVEYDTEEANPWVPYPINYTNLTKLLKSAGFTAITKITEMPSKYNSVSAISN